MKIYSTEFARELAQELLNIQSIKINLHQPFTWASSWKSPIYCDNRITLSYPELRKKIKNKLADCIKKNFNMAEGIVGVATGGIPQGSLVADTLNLPFCYVRSSSKGHGLRNKVEGDVIKNQKMVVVEDLISTGKSSLDAVHALKAQQVNVIGMVSIFSYNLGIAKENFIMYPFTLYYLCSYEYILQYAKEKGLFNQKELDSLEKWTADPANWHP